MGTYPAKGLSKQDVKDTLQDYSEHINPLTVDADEVVHITSGSEKVVSKVTVNGTLKNDGAVIIR